MEISDRLKCLYGKDMNVAYANLKELEAISEHENTLYPYFDELITMLKSEKYVIRVRGIRLLCKLAKWDIDDKINKHIDEILVVLYDVKPTAVREALQYLKYIVLYKIELVDKIKKSVLLIDCFDFKDTMRPLIQKDIQSLLEVIEMQ